MNSIENASSASSPSTEANVLTTRVLSWLNTMHIAGNPIWEYRMNSGSDATVFNSCFAVSLLHLFGQLERLSNNDRSEWTRYIQSFQDPRSGLFSDPQTAERTNHQRDTKHMDWQLTAFSLSALDALGAGPLFDLTFAQRWYEKECVTDWLSSLDWGNPWHCGNKVMFIGVFLYFMGVRRGNKSALGGLDAWFNWLDAHQNQRSGFWGTGKQSEYYAGMGGAYHEYVIYNSMAREIQYRERVVDRTLQLQQVDGLFVPPRSGGSCDDFDAVDILVNMYHKIDYRRQDIRDALTKALDGILENQNNDGGFCWAKSYQLKAQDQLRAVTELADHRDAFLWAYNMRRTIRDQRRTAQDFPILTAWNAGPRSRQTSSIFDTWLRCAAIGQISSVLSDSPFASIDWCFLGMPGLGWFEKPR